MSLIWYVLALLWVLDALRMRRRLTAIAVLPDASESKKSDYSTFRVQEADVNDGTRNAAISYAQSQNLDLLDLIPADTPALVSLSLLQIVDPATYRRNRVASGFTAGAAMVVSQTLLEKAKATPAAVVSEIELRKLARHLRRFAGERADLAIAPHLKASKAELLTSWPVWEAGVIGNAHGLFMLRMIMLVLLVTGIVLFPMAGLAAVAALHLQVLLTFAGTRLSPRDLWIVVLLRTPLEALDCIRTFVSRLRSPDPRALLIEERRPYYTAALKAGTDRFLEPRRKDCPLCGSTNLKVRVRNPDRIQRKPGRFTLEQCSDCQYTFQNPRLSPAGLEFYYRDFYDGLGGMAAETMFRARPGLYESRARVVDGFLEPKKWLDVGTGQGHFCAAARSAWPETEFDGLDISENIDDAVRAGWMNRGYCGFFPDMADQLKGFYDVVSMFHCLEHTPDQRKEIAAAYVALAPGGVVLLEMPNPECVLGRFLGRFWLPWFQPQHLNMPTVKNLERILQEQGFEIVKVQVAEAHLPIDVFSAVMLIFGSISPKMNLPWNPKPRFYHHIRHFAVWIVGFPVIITAMGIDSLIGPLCQRVGISNAYRIVARRPASAKSVREEPAMERVAG